MVGYQKLGYRRRPDGSGFVHRIGFLIHRPRHRKSSQFAHPPRFIHIPTSAIFSTLLLCLFRKNARDKLIFAPANKYNIVGPLETFLFAKQTPDRYREEPITGFSMVHDVAAEQFYTTKAELEIQA